MLLFLHEKHFEPVQGMVLDDAKRLRIAALACLPILELGLDAYAAFHSIVVHPDEFLVRDREYEDEDGVVHVGDDLLSGEAFEQGPVVFAWTEIEASARGEGYNVVAHEMAHKLDMLSGETNGVPPLHADMRTPEWVAAFDAAYDDLCEQIERGVTPWIDPYAVEDSAEFFAVSVELFFDHAERAAGGVSRRLRAAETILQAGPRRRVSRRKSAFTRFMPNQNPIALTTSAPRLSVIMPMSHSGRLSYQKPKSRLCRPL